MSISTNYSYRPIDSYYATIKDEGLAANQSRVWRLGKRNEILSGTDDQLNSSGPTRWSTNVLVNPQVQARMDRGQMGPLTPQAYKDQSADSRTGLQSFFSAGSRYREKDAYQQNHVSVSGVPGMVHMAVLDAEGRKIPYAPFSWGGRTYHTDADGKFTILEKQYFQNVVSAENERVKYVTQMISLVIGQPAENVIAMFGMDLYRALGPDNTEYTVKLYKTYMLQAGIRPDIIEQKAEVFRMYADADATPEVMPNYGDGDPAWSRAFNKLSQLLEYHPSAILFDEGMVDPTVDSGVLEGKRDVVVPMATEALQQVTAEASRVTSAAAPPADGVQDTAANP